MVWNCLPTTKLRGYNCWSLGMKYFHSTFYWAWGYFSMRELKLNHDSIRPRLGRVSRVRPGIGSDRFICSWISATQTIACRRQRFVNGILVSAASGNHYVWRHTTVHCWAQCHCFPWNVRPKWRSMLSVGVGCQWRIVSVTSRVRIRTAQTLSVVDKKQCKLEFLYWYDNRTALFRHCVNVICTMETAWLRLKRLIRTTKEYVYKCS